LRVAHGQIGRRPDGVWLVDLTAGPDPAALIAVLLATMASTTGAASAAAGRLPGTGLTSFSPGPRSADNHCVSPEGVNANQLQGISEPLFLPGACGDVIDTGEFYVPLGPGWLTMNTFWETMPADYTPSAPTPLEDFLPKLPPLPRVTTISVPPSR
jgi:hypothetical protein